MPTIPRWRVTCRSPSTRSRDDERGAVIVVSPFAAGGGGENRTSVVVRCDRDNQGLSNTVVAMIAGNRVHALAEPAQLFTGPPLLTRSPRSNLMRRQRGAVIFNP
jgi:hypothetical protein